MRGGDRRRRGAIVPFAPRDDGRDERGDRGSYGRHLSRVSRRSVAWRWQLPLHRQRNAHSDAATLYALPARAPGAPRCRQENAPQCELRRAPHCA